MSDETKPSVGFVGLGTMGAPMASNLQKAGYQLVVNDSRRDAGVRHVEAGAILAATPRELAHNATSYSHACPTLPLSRPWRLVSMAS